MIARSSIALADGVRRLALKQTLKIPLAREVFVRPERRIPIVQLFCLTTSLALSVLHPVLVLSLGASLLGVPHVVSGIRQSPFAARCIACPWRWRSSESAWERSSS